MPDQRVGTLDNPAAYDARQVSVYENSKGYYIKLDGLREKLHGSTRWTTTSGVEMKGRTQHVQQPPSAWSEEWDGDDLALAIAASLADAAPAGYEPAGPMEEEPADVAPPAAPPAAADEATSRTCAICLTNTSVMLMRSCNHLCACEGCAQRPVGRPCCICRRVVTAVERVYYLLTQHAPPPPTATYWHPPPLPHTA